MFKNKFLGILILVTVFAVVFYTVLGAMGATSPFHGLLGTVSTPFRAVLNWAGESISGFGDYFTEYRRLAEENREMAEYDNGSVGRISFFKYTLHPLNLSITHMEPHSFFVFRSNSWKQHT